MLEVFHSNIANLAVYRKFFIYFLFGLFVPTWYGRTQKYSMELFLVKAFHLNVPSCFAPMSCKNGMNCISPKNCVFGPILVHPPASGERGGIYLKP